MKWCEPAVHKALGPPAHSLSSSLLAGGEDGLDIEHDVRLPVLNVDDDVSKALRLEEIDDALHAANARRRVDNVRDLHNDLLDLRPQRIADAVEDDPLGRLDVHLQQINRLDRIDAALLAALVLEEHLLEREQLAVHLRPLEAGELLRRLLRERNGEDVAKEDGVAEDGGPHEAADDLIVPRIVGVNVLEVANEGANAIEQRVLVQRSEELALVHTAAGGGGGEEGEGGRAALVADATAMEHNAVAVRRRIGRDALLQHGNGLRDVDAGGRVLLGAPAREETGVAANIEDEGVRNAVEGNAVLEVAAVNVDLLVDHAGHEVAADVEHRRGGGAVDGAADDAAGLIHDVAVPAVSCEGGGTCRDANKERVVGNGLHFVYF